MSPKRPRRSPTEKQERVAALSLFSGLGGFDLAAAIAGLAVRLATDIDERALQLLRVPFGTPTLVGSIDDVLQGDLFRAWPTDSPPRVLVGGPPCTAFSHAGFWLPDKRDGKDPASLLLSSYLDAVDQFRPEAFVLENVPGLAFRTHRRFLEDFLRRARRMDFTTSVATLNAAEFSVPQARRRLFVVGARGGRHVDLDEWPAWPTRSARWAIGDLVRSKEREPDEVPGGAYTELLREVPPGSNYLVFTDRYGCDPPLFKNRGRYWSFLLKAHPDRPAATVPAQRVTFNGPFHWTGRHLRIRELARLQGFPDWYPLDEDLPMARRHIGNAVPPLMAAAVIWRVRQALGDVPSASWPPALELAADPAVSVHDVLAAYPAPTSTSGVLAKKGRAS